MLFDLANLPYWIFLVLGVTCFLSVIFTGAEDDDFTAEGDFELEGEIETPLGWLGIGKTPLILLLGIDFSTWGVVGWMLNILVASYTGEIPGNFWGLGGLIFALSLAIALLVGKILAYPLGKIFAAFGEDARGDRLVGCVGTVTSKQLPYFPEGKIGQADVIDSYHNLVTISVSLPYWAKVIPHRGQQILIIEQKSQVYLAIAKDSSDEDYWLNNRDS